MGKGKLAAVHVAELNPDNFGENEATGCDWIVMEAIDDLEAIVERCSV